MDYVLKIKYQLYYLMSGNKPNNFIISRPRLVPGVNDGNTTKGQTDRSESPPDQSGR